MSFRLSKEVKTKAVTSAVTTRKGPRAKLGKERTTSDPMVEHWEPVTSLRGSTQPWRSTER